MGNDHDRAVYESGLQNAAVKGRDTPPLSDDIKNLVNAFHSESNEVLALISFMEQQLHPVLVDAQSPPSTGGISKDPSPPSCAIKQILEGQINRMQQVRLALSTVADRIDL